MQLQVLPGDGWGNYFCWRTNLSAPTSTHLEALSSGTFACRQSGCNQAPVAVFR